MRKHRNTSRLTARERAQAFLQNYGYGHLIGSSRQGALEEMLQAHAREAVDRYKRRYARAAEKAMGK